MNKPLTRPRILDSNGYTAQESNKLSSILPYELRVKIFSYLEDKGRNRFVSTCKENYYLIHDFYANKLHFRERLPKAIVESMSMKQLRDLPYGILPQSFANVLPIVDAIYKKDNPIVTNKIGCKVAKFYINVFSSFRLDKFLWPISDLFKHFKQQPIHIIRTQEGLGLVILLRYTPVKEEPKDLQLKQQALIIIKVGGQWRVINLNTSGSMWLFLNNIHYYPDKSSKVQKYFERLLNGKDCGSFPDNLNAQVTIDYQLSDSINQLQEGPTTSSDGQPVIQLWKN